MSDAKPLTAEELSKKFRTRDSSVSHSECVSIADALDTARARAEKAEARVAILEAALREVRPFTLDSAAELADPEADYEKLCDARALMDAALSGSSDALVLSAVEVERWWDLLRSSTDNDYAMRVATKLRALLDKRKGGG